MVPASRSGLTGTSAKDNGDRTSLWTGMVWRRQRKASMKGSSKKVNGMAKALSSGIRIRVMTKTGGGLKM